MPNPCREGEEKKLSVIYKHLKTRPLILRRQTTFCTQSVGNYGKITNYVVLFSISRGTPPTAPSVSDLISKKMCIPVIR